MKRLLLPIILFACAYAMTQAKPNDPIKIDRKWHSFNPGEVIFEDKSPDTKGSRIYHSIISNPTPYIQENALRVLQTLYKSPKDKHVPDLQKIYYTIEEYDGISEKYGYGDYVGIRYSTRWIESNFKNNDTTKVDYETRGVLYHELTHAYQLEPQGCGSYGDGGEYWCFIEGMADAVRVACGCFGQDFSSNDRPRRGHWSKGYRYAGYFIYWLSLNKDREFIRKFNRSAIELNPWSWDAAMKHILGNKPENGVESLWYEYQQAIGDDKQFH